MTAAYPLTWPESFPRSTRRETGAFKTSLAKALENVQTSLRLFGRDSGKAVSAVVLSSNVTLGAARPADPGVAVWFSWDGMQVCIPVDRYATVEANLQAIHHILEARRTELRHGTLALVRATFQGFRALPAPGRRTWREVLVLDGPLFNRDQIERRFRELAKQRHPDAGGSAEAMAELNRARDEALKEIAGSAP
ncbi:J domain-containing protein [Inquilinus sp.]|uniref:J domain-containing protein n=1 Tax=Inquilinus sp. TaxID=1932117 RepID=UPI0031D843E1